MAAAALLFGAACKRASVELPGQTPELTPPAPSSSLVMTSLDKAATGYTNEMQAAHLKKQAAMLGIQQIGRHIKDGKSGQENRDAPAPLSEVETRGRMAQLKEMRLEFTRMRRSIDDARDKSVVLPGSTTAIIPRLKRSKEPKRK